MKGKEVTVTLGYVGVDSGHLMVGDPCYVLPDDKKTQGYWDEFLAGVEKRDNWNEDPKAPKNPGIPIVDNMAMCFPSGMGDGLYPVTAELEHYGSWGWRVNSVTIHMLNDHDDDHDEDEDEDA